MRILHFAPPCDESGNGVVNVAVDLACKQAEAGYRVGLVSGKGSLLPLLERYGVTHIEADFRLRNPLRVTRTLLALYGALHRFAPDIIHAHCVPGAVYARALQAVASFRLVTTVHNEPFRQAALMGVGDLVTVFSVAGLQGMTRRGIPAGKLRVVKNGPLGSPRRPASQSCIPHEMLQRPSITTVAALHPRKGIADLIAAFGMIAKEFPRASLNIIGQGPERQSLEAQAAASGYGDRVRFLGFVKDPRAYLRQTDIFVLASHRDPFALVLPEAREAGCAIVATAVDGTPDALESGRAGILIPPENPPALAKALQRLLQFPGELAEWRRRSSENLAWLRIDRLVEDTIAVYYEALAPKQWPNAPLFPHDQRA